MRNDADAAAAMRHLRRRVQQLNGPNASEPSDFAYQLINSPPKSTPIGSGSMQHLLLAAYEMVDPRVVQERSMRPRRAPIEPTSLWCMSWGTTADERLVNFNYAYSTGTAAAEERDECVDPGGLHPVSRHAPSFALLFERFLVVQLRSASFCLRDFA